MSWKAEFMVEKEWWPHPHRFPTNEETVAFATHLYMEWTTPTQRRVVESDDPPTHTWCGKKQETTRIVKEK